MFRLIAKTNILNNRPDFALKKASGFALTKAHIAMRMSIEFIPFLDAELLMAGPVDDVAP
jgi:hypothetical protein